LAAQVRSDSRDGSARLANQELAALRGVQDRRVPLDSMDKLGRSASKVSLVTPALQVLEDYLVCREGPDRQVTQVQVATMVLPDHAVPRVNLVSRAPSDSLVMLASPETLDLLDLKDLRATLANRVSSSVITAGLEPAGSK